MAFHKSALLSKSEISWLHGEMKVSKPYERRLRFSIKNKLKAFAELELPLLIEKGYVSKGLDVTDTCNAVTEYCNGKNLDSYSFCQNKEPWPGFGPGTFALPRQRSTRLSYQGSETDSQIFTHIYARIHACTLNQYRKNIYVNEI